jgi:hypothetical protein
VVFLFEFKEFPLRNQIYVLTVLLLYIFSYLFSYDWFGVYNYFQYEDSHVLSAKHFVVDYYVRQGVPFIKTV